MELGSGAYRERQRRALSAAGGLGAGRRRAWVEHSDWGCGGLGAALYRRTYGEAAADAVIEERSNQGKQQSQNTQFGIRRNRFLCAYGISYLAHVNTDSPAKSALSVETLSLISRPDLRR